MERARGCRELRHTCLLGDLLGCVDSLPPLAEGRLVEAAVLREEDVEGQGGGEDDDGARSEFLERNVDLHGGRRRRGALRVEDDGDAALSGGAHWRGLSELQLLRPRGEPKGVLVELHRQRGHGLAQRHVGDAQLEGHGAVLANEGGLHAACGGQG